MAAKKKRTVLPSLSEMEWEILKPLWERGPMAARDICAAVPEERAWSPNTVKTMLARLVKKGALTYEEVGNSYLYRAVHTREEMTENTVRSFVDRVFDGAMRPFLSNFAEGVPVEELRILRNELARIERQRRERGDTE